MMKLALQASPALARPGTTAKVMPHMNVVVATAMLVWHVYGVTELAL